MQSLFAEWRESPPSWASELLVPPHAYAYEVGWELLANGKRRDLFFETTLPLVKQEEVGAIDPAVATGISHDQSCPWCKRQLVFLFDFDLSADRLSFLELEGSRLRIATCDVCTAYGLVFASADRNGGAKWHSKNQLPEYFLDDSSDWDAFPENPLVLSGDERHFLESASWTGVPGVRFSQVGGLPTWVQDAEYPECPDCSRRTLFLGQISNEDFGDLMEGIQYTFLCTSCDTTAAHYQQS